MTLPDQLRNHPLVLFPGFRNFFIGSVLVSVAASFFGLVTTVIAGIAPLSYMFVGFVSDWLGVKQVMTVSGTGLLLLTGSVLIIPRLRQHIGYVDEWG